eukprot:3230815-Rhodomonas_salina.4
MSSTDLGYAATHLLRDVRYGLGCTGHVRFWHRVCCYAFAMRSPVLTGCYAMCGADLAYAATLSYGMCSTDIAYAATSYRKRAGKGERGGGKGGREGEEWREGEREGEREGGRSVQRAEKEEERRAREREERAREREQGERAGRPKLGGERGVQEGGYEREDEGEEGPGGGEESGLVLNPSGLRACYAVSGSGIAYAAMRCPVRG